MKQPSQAKNQALLIASLYLGVFIVAPFTLLLVLKLSLPAFDTQPSLGIETIAFALLFVVATYHRARTNAELRAESLGLLATGLLALYIFSLSGGFTTGVGQFFITVSDVSASFNIAKLAWILVGLVLLRSSLHVFRILEIRKNQKGRAKTTS